MSTQSGTSAVPSLECNDGRQIPQLGFGVFQIDSGDTAEAVRHALQTGYRSIDTAAAYGNEAEVGEAIKSSGLAREDIFVTTKLGNGDHGHDSALRALDASLERLGFDYVDLYLIHWPIPSQNRYADTWQALCELRQDGRARSIGVSNFMVEHLERIVEQTGVTPAVNQIELHPRFQQAELRSFHEAHGILTEAWGPLGQGTLLDDETLGQIAAGHGRSAAQIMLRWHLQLGNVVIPKSATPKRIEENFRVFDFELSEEEMRAIEGLDSGESGRIGPHPERFG